MYYAHKSLAGWVLDTVNWLFEPDPGSQAYVKILADTIKSKNNEKNKPEGQRDEQRLLELNKQVLRLQAKRWQVSNE